MATAVDEIGPRIFRLSTFVPEIGPMGFTFNQFLIDDDDALLFHTGHRWLFGSVSEAIERVLPLRRLRWIAFGRVEADECGALNLLLAAAPNAEVVHGALACAVSLNDLADRRPRALGDGDVLGLGAMRVRHLDTPHVPHAWEASLLFEETTATLLCGDLFTRLGNGPALTADDIVGPAEHAEDALGYSSLAPQMVATIDRLAELEPRTLALMHGSSFAGDGGAALRALSASYGRRIGAKADQSLPVQRP